MNKIKEIEREVKKIFKESAGCHDLDHTLRVLKLAVHIGEKEGADLKIIQLAAFLHDISRDEEKHSKGKICHAEHGAQKAEMILKKYGYPPMIIEKIKSCIKTHRFRRGNIPESLEAKIIFDADKLDTIGAIGVARAYVYAGEMGAKVHDSHPKLGKEAEYTKEDTGYREFIVKLSKVKGRLFTSEGKRLAKKRHNFMVKFFDEINQEVEGEI